MSIPAATTFQFLNPREPGTTPISARFRSGVSLHSHTMFSEESLDMIPRYTAKVPYLGNAIRRQQAEYSVRKGREFDFGCAFWTPPLAPRQAYRLEEKQIQRQFQLPALISLTDHDDLRAFGLLRLLNRSRYAPASLEWTIPFGPTFFHLGIHNLPAERAQELYALMQAFTAHPDPATLGVCLNHLNQDPQTLVVLNHPLWDEKGIGASAHRGVLTGFLEEHARAIHALEANGLRSWQENKDVITLARSLNLPVVSGGDRHGREPNAILNLSEAASFAGFVEEVRHMRRSHVVFMPQYREPLKARVLQTIVDIVRDYPENIEGRRLWSDRVFYRDPISGQTLPLTAFWKDSGPAVVRSFILVMRLLERRSVRSALRLALEDRAVVWPDSGVSV